MAGLGRAGAGRQPSMHRLTHRTRRGGIAAIPAIATSGKFGATTFSQHISDTSNCIMLTIVVGQST